MMASKIFKKALAATIYLYLVTTVACTKTDHIPASQKSSNYYPVSSGKVWVYRLDSIITSDFGSSLIIRSYHLKDSTGTAFIDNAGRESFTVYRFITDTLEQNPWQSISTYYVTPTNTSIEVVDDNNLRFIKLVTPVRNGNAWQGNSYIDTRSATSPLQYLDGWNYIYQAVDSQYTTLAGTIDSTATVFQQDLTSPDVPFDPQFFQQHDYSVEVYAKNIGLIYKNFLHWVWQPTPEPARYADGSYGIILNLISYK